LSVAPLVPLAFSVVILDVSIVPGDIWIGGYVGLLGLDMLRLDIGSVVRTLDTEFLVRVATASTGVS